MIFEVKKGDKTYNVDDLKLFHQQTKAFQKAFNQAEKSDALDLTIAHFDNADAILYTNSSRVLITLKEIEDENN